MTTLIETATAPRTAATPLDIDAIRRDFPILEERVNGKQVVYFDSGASSQRAESVVQAMNDYMHHFNANIHRGVYKFSEEATLQYERAHVKVAKFINARSSKEIIFSRNTTESINLVAYSWGRANVKPGDEILATVMEHHSNIVPWQMLAEMTGATLRYLDITPDGYLDLSDIDNAINPRTKLVAVTHQSNVLGTINPVAELARRAHAVGAVILVDGAQSVPHMPVDVQALDCDFLAFSGHKMVGPTGIGVLYGKRALLEAMPPFLTGGDMIREVTLQKTTWNDLPWKFEAGTPAIAEGIGLGAAVDYLRGVGMEHVRQHDLELTRYAVEQMQQIPDLTIYGPQNAEDRGGVVAFTLADIHAHDLATLLDQDGVCVRAGHHCTQPLHDRMNVEATARASFYIYNTLAEVDAFIVSLWRARKAFGLA